VHIIADNASLIVLIAVGWFVLGGLTVYLFSKVIRYADGQRDEQ
jgi:uncharacterized membrane protein SpoIIM required for sporulation